MVHMITAEASGRVLGLALVLAATACGPAGGEQVSANHIGRLSLSTNTSQPSVAVMAPTQAAIMVEHVWISWDALRFYGCSGYNEAEVAPKVATDFTLGENLDYTLPQDEFCALTSAFVPAVHPIPATAPSAFFGRSLVIEGRRADGTEFLLASEDTPVVRLQSGGEFPIGDTPVDFVVSFDVGRAFAGIDLSQATVDTGLALLDNTNNSALLARFEQQVLNAFTLHVDQDSNRRADPHEPAIATTPPQ